MDELETLPLTLADLQRQRYRDFSVHICVNQPDSWWSDGDAGHQAVCRRNASLIQWLQDGVEGLEIHVMDCSSPGCGWSGKQHGVGQARKRLFDAVSSEAVSEAGLLVSLDADTRIDADYLRRLVSTFDACPSPDAVAAPYYHRLTGDEVVDRPLLRYECYMRHYLLQLLRIGSPYAFTALGSAMAFTCRAYRRAGGMAPLQGGEDFYLMQKFAKTGHIALRLQGGTGADEVLVFPSGRVSRRVPFGTGPAVAMQPAGQAVRYPFFAPSGFDAVAETYSLFPTLYERDVETPMSAFLRRQLATGDLWGPLRRNHTSPQRFVRACRERVDGLRILQYLRSRPDGILPDCALADFTNETLSRLDDFRNTLLRQEMMLR
ncbi:MAG: hypothetical protein AUK63_974 [bacterium P3]|nr:MAG: hypothetical protein AUK63_974 [bacterium P3]KWW41020.1 MAG: hypothetical protein F083_1187 [bacterium F083]